MSSEGSGEAALKGALDRASSLDDLWKKLQQRLQVVGPCFAVDAGFACRGAKPLVHFHVGPAEAKLPWWPCTEGDPMQRHLSANAKSRLVRLSDLAPDPDALLRSEFGRKAMEVGKWRYAVTMCFRHEGAVEGQVVLRRTKEQSDFTESEMSRLRQVQREIGDALQHLRSLHEQRAVREMLEDLLRNTPMSLLVLNRKLRPVVCNRAAKQQCAAWNLGDAARTINSPEAYRVPAEIQRAAEEVCRHWEVHGINDSTTPHRVAHPERPGLEAALEVLESRGSCLGSPLIRVHFPHDGNGSSSPKKGTAGPDLSKLTAQELEVIRLVARGLSNQEIAAELSKSVYTVKTQVHTAYRKLGIRRRAKLMLLFR